MDLASSGNGYLTFLDHQGIESIHKATLNILEHTGVVIDHPLLQEILKGVGGTVETCGNLVKIRSDLIEDSLKRAPKTITIHARRAENTIVLNGTTIYTHTAAAPLFIYASKSGKRRPAVTKDLEAAARLVDGLENIHAYIPLVSPTDIHSRTVEFAEMVVSAAKNTSKVIANAVMSASEVELMHKIFTAIAGGERTLKENPMCMILASPISPLYYDADICGALVLAARLGIPTIILPCPMAGGTSPVTFAGALAQQNAELLAGLAIMQAVSPGAPVIFGPRLSLMDMRTGAIAWGSAEVGMASACAVQLAHYYGIPVDVYGLCSDATVLDQQLGYERAMNAMLAALAGGDFISGAGFMESAKTASLEQLVIDNEIFGMILKVIKGFEINADTLATEIIHNVGPRGNFLREVHTREHTRGGEQYFPKISNRLGWNEWIEQGGQDVVEVARIRAQEILASPQSMHLDDYVLKELNSLLSNVRRV